MSFGRFKPSWHLNICVSWNKSSIFHSLLLHLFFFNYFKNVLVLAVLGLSCVQALSSCGAWSSYCSGLSCCGFRACGLQQLWCEAQLLCMWNLPGPGTELVSLALQSRFLTIGPPGKPNSSYIFKVAYIIMFEYLAYINFKRVVSHCRVNLMNLLETFNSKKSPGKSIQKKSPN